MIPEIKQWMNKIKWKRRMIVNAFNHDKFQPSNNYGRFFVIFRRSAFIWLVANWFGHFHRIYCIWKFKTMMSHGTKGRIDKWFPSKNKKKSHKWIALLPSLPFGSMIRERHSVYLYILYAEWMNFKVSKHNKL